MATTKEKFNEKHEDDNDSTKDQENNFLLTSYLDEMEDRIEALRHGASSLIKERDSLVTILSNMKADCCRENGGDTQDLVVNIDRLQARCQSVQIVVHTVRTLEQQSCFSQVDNLVKYLEHQCCLSEGEDYRQKAESYLNACLSDLNRPGNIDYKFQGIILGCKIEDQKHIRHRLECLVQGRCHVDFIHEMIENSQTNFNAEDISKLNSTASKNPVPQDASPSSPQSIDKDSSKNSLTKCSTQ